MTYITSVFYVQYPNGITYFAKCLFGIKPHGGNFETS